MPNEQSGMTNEQTAVMLFAWASRLAALEDDLWDLFITITDDENCEVRENDERWARVLRVHADAIYNAVETGRDMQRAVEMLSEKGCYKTEKLLSVTLDE